MIIIENIFLTAKGILHTILLLVHSVAAANQRTLQASLDWTIIKG